MQRLQNSARIASLLRYKCSISIDCFSRFVYEVNQYEISDLALQLLRRGSRGSGAHMLARAELQLSNKQQYRILPKHHKAESKVGQS